MALVFLLGGGTIAYADFPPSAPITLWGDRLAVSGEVTVTFGSEDDGYFNAIDYSHDALNLLTFALSAELKATDRIAVLGQVLDEVSLRSRDFGPEDRHVIRPYAFFARVQPWLTRPLVIQAGRIPPVFGAFARLDYGTGNPLIGLPLAYHYPTLIRGDVVPPDLDQLIANRGEGWFVRYPPSSDEGAAGVALVSGRRWDTGVQARWGDGPIELAASVTNGTLSKPLTRDDNGGKQVSARVGVRPAAGLLIGGSIAAGEFVPDRVRSSLPPDIADGDYEQRTLGVDLEWSRGPTLVRGESIWNRWELPLRDAATRRLDAWSGWIEGRVTLSPRWYVAGRLDRLAFDSIDIVTAGAGGGSSTTPMASPPPTRVPSDPSYAPDSAAGPNAATGVESMSWDAPVTRLEVGAGYRALRNVRLKVSYQYNWRDGGRVRREGLAAAQMVYWF